jgi:hypothetical protein
VIAFVVRGGVGLCLCYRVCPTQADGVGTQVEVVSIYLCVIAFVKRWSTRWSRFKLVQLCIDSTSSACVHRMLVQEAESNSYTSEGIDELCCAHRRKRVTPMCIPKDRRLRCAIGVINSLPMCNRSHLFPQCGNETED